MKEAIANRVEQDAMVKKTKKIYNKENTTRQSNKRTWPQSKIADSTRALQSSIEEAVDNWNGQDLVVHK